MQERPSSEEDSPLMRRRFPFFPSSRDQVGDDVHEMPDSLDGEWEGVSGGGGGVATMGLFTAGLSVLRLFWFLHALDSFLSSPVTKSGPSGNVWRRTELPPPD